MSDTDKLVDSLDAYIMDQTSSLGDSEYIDVLDDLISRLRSARDAKEEELD